ncbi:DUF421 domain-containing protein [Gimesia fumaroli]|jgi:uncharacterized membrane protein YcaP (DUF421 family)|uniref:YetF C-terminal domain-containing protein n=1 Tax=Gimesia fumaroli TaxID=2527976 RepID=A0A518I4P3_9PLAN|nr:YetF domain-containing protein [Gimesia fumaroli]QDV48072.1 hypothetical protein Enr17x_00810 [Gimesia fumaroli]
MFTKWITGQWNEIPMVLLSCLVTYSLILVYTRVTGLRSFSKMSASDFVMTLAVGSIFASIISMSTPSVVIGLTALASLFFGQWLLALLRLKFNWFSKLVDNEPLLLMHGRHMLEENLEKANVTRADVYGKLREANALNYDQVLAVIFETTGDISVLHADDPEIKLEPDFFQNVIGSERLLEDHEIETSSLAHVR